MIAPVDKIVNQKGIEHRDRDVTGQYVIGDDGRMVRGVWLMTDQDEEADVPIVVKAESLSDKPPSPPYSGARGRG